MNQKQAWVPDTEPDRAGRREGLPVLPILLCVALMVTVLGFTALKIQSMRREGHMARVFWEIDDARASAQALFDSAYYAPEKERSVVKRRLQLKLAELENARDELTDLQSRRIKRDDPRMVSMHTMYYDVRNLIELYILTIGPRDHAMLHEIKKREAEVLREYERSRNSVAASLNIPDRKRIEARLQRDYEEKYRK